MLSQSTPRKNGLFLKSSTPFLPSRNFCSQISPGGREREGEGGGREGGDEEGREGGREGKRRTGGREREGWREV